MKQKSFSSDYYDGHRQDKAWWNDPDDKVTNRKTQRDALRSRLRFDFLFSPSISLHRADVLDGACFQHTEPDEIRKWLGIQDNDPLPIIILTNTGSLEKDLMEWVKPPGAESLFAEPFFLIPPDMRDTYYTEFPKLNIDTIRDYKDLAHAIAHTVSSRDLGDSLSKTWSQWITRIPSFNMKRFTKAPDYPKYLDYALDDVMNALAYDNGTDKYEDGEAIGLYSAAVDVFREQNWSRGSIVRWLDEELPQRSSSSVGQIVRDAINIGITRARADVNDTNHETTLGTRLSEDSVSNMLLKRLTDHPVTKKRVPPIHVDIPDHITRWLIECDYEGLLKHIAILRETWFHNNDQDSLKRLAEAITKFIQNSPNSLPELSENIARVARFLPVLCAGLPRIVKIVIKCAASTDESSALVKKDIVYHLVKKDIVSNIVQTVWNRIPR